MTEASRASATEIDLAAADWVQRRHLWLWTEADQSEFEAWIAMSDTNHVAYLRQEAVWNSAGRLSALRQQPMRPSSAPTKSGRLTLLRSVVAVTIAIAAGLTGYAYLKRPAEVTYVTAVGGHKIISLADGTRIELNTDSALQIRTGAVRRVALLHGEAYFDVQHDATDPFAVTAGSYRVTDIGTKFAVRASVEGIRVSLLEGSAVVAPLAGYAAHRSALLMPGDVVIANAQKLTVEKQPVASVVHSLDWRRGLLTFKDTELADAVAEFNRYNARKLRIEDPIVGHLRINGSFQAENADLFASSVQELFGLRVRKDGKDITLSH